MRASVPCLPLVLYPAIAFAQPSEGLPLRVRTDASERVGYDVEVRGAAELLRCGAVTPGRACDVRVAPAPVRLTLRRVDGTGAPVDLRVDLFPAGTLVELGRSGTGWYISAAAAFVLGAASAVWWHAEAGKPPPPSYLGPSSSEPTYSLRTYLAGSMTVGLAVAGTTFAALGRWLPLRRVSVRPLDAPPGTARLDLAPIPGGAALAASGSF